MVWFGRINEGGEIRGQKEHEENQEEEEEEEARGRLRGVTFPLCCLL